MADDADVLDRLSGVDVHVLASVIGQPTAEQRVRLIEFLGPQRYARLRDLALRRGTSARPERGLGNVVLIPGILGSELARLNSAGERRTIWPRASELAAGGMMNLRLGRDGRAGPTASGAIYARGIVTRHYGELLLTLAERWNVRAFWYDWRKDVRIAASELETRLREWFPDGAPVHLIGHGMGGLVARRFTLAYPERWAMSSVPAAQRGRLILLGTPNRGVPAAAQVLAGIDPIVYKLSALDVGHSHDELREVLATFPSLHQLLPAPELAERIYDATTWGDLNISQSFLDLAKAHHAQSASVAGDDRTIVVAGGGSPTVTGLPPGDLDKPAHYRVTCAGDGHVPIASARLDGSAATYFVDAGHADLLTDRAVLRALPDLLEFGRTDLLGTEPPDAAGGADPAAAYDGARDREVLAVKELVSRQARRGESRGSRHLGRGQERDVEDLLVRGVIASTVSAADETAAAAHADRAGDAQITVTVVQGAIEQIHKLVKGIDATAVGHYVDVPPQAAEAAIDAAISNLREGDEVPETERVINSLTNRGVLGGRLGEVFLLPDPRGKREALIALAGMGEPGRFGVPELTVLARELCWTLGRLRKHRLATVLIGSGNGNLTIEESVDGWLRGVRAAVQTAPAREGEGLEEITFVEADPRKIARIHTALADWCERTDGGIRYRSPSREAERQIR
ncbi:MAG TPA: hypothetical protein VD836_01315, partial [Solirubrobacteraceae bacterium]|nr:hypothetical protein [Solirubrobacteraceae bacterium]